MNTLTISKASSLIGKQVKWTAASFGMNNPYGGTAIITAIVDGYNPIEATTIDGDDLSAAFIGIGGLMAYSDSDRTVFIIE